MHYQTYQMVKFHPKIHPENNISYNKIKKGVLKTLVYMAGVAGFEPAVHDTKNRCLTTWLHPIRSFFISFHFPVQVKKLLKRH